MPEYLVIHKDWAGGRLRREIKKALKIESTKCHCQNPLNNHELLALQISPNLAFTATKCTGMRVIIGWVGTHRVGRERI